MKYQKVKIIIPLKIASKNKIKYSVESKIQYKSTYLWYRNRLTDTENRHGYQTEGQIRGMELTNYYT